MIREKQKHCIFYQSCVVRETQALIPSSAGEATSTSLGSVLQLVKSCGHPEAKKGLIFCDQKSPPPCSLTVHWLLHICLQGSCYSASMFSQALLSSSY